jgi:CHRD domain-containing protein
MTRLSRMGIAVATILALTTVPAFAKTSVFNAHLSGDNEVPARQTHATGQATFTLSTDGTSLQYRINASNIENVVGVRLQLAPAGETGPEIAVLFGPVAPGGGRVTGVLATGILTAPNLIGPMAGRTISDLISEVQAGRVYVNVVTDDGLAPSDQKPGDFSSGEIRGQLQ